MLKNTKILIIGAGAAGIAAACKLLENGEQNFVILEANDKIGGRICTKNFGKIVFKLLGFVGVFVKEF